MGELLTARQACDQLGIHINTFYRWVKSGYLGAVKLGGTEKSGYRVAQATIDRLLAGTSNHHEAHHTR